MNTLEEDIRELVEKHTPPAFPQITEFMGKTFDYWYELDHNAKGKGISDMVLENAKLRLELERSQAQYAAYKTAIENTLSGG